MNKKVAAITLAALFTAVAGSAGARSAGHELSFYNTHTGESLTANPDTAGGRRAINHILRDFREHKAVNMNPRLLVRLERIKAALEREGHHVVFNIVSGYRSPETNEWLRKTRGGQAKKSQHMLGNAIDIRVPGVSTEHLRDTAWCEGGGGVGYYTGNKFVHVDAGRKRFWNWAPEPGMCHGPNA